MTNPVAYLEEQRRRQKEWSQKPETAWDDDEQGDIDAYDTEPEEDAE